MVDDVAVNSIKSIVSNFNDRYKKRVLRYLRKSIKKLEKDIKKNK